MSPSFFQILVVVLLLVVLFGRGKISDLMGDVAKGIKSFKQGMADDDHSAEEAPRVAERRAEEPAAPRGEPIDVTPEAAPRPAAASKKDSA